MNRKAISLLSGGLDSLLASKIVIGQGIEVVGVHYTSPLCNSIKDDKGEGALVAGEELGIKVLIRDKGEDYLKVVRNPKHGYGKNMNPCIDCRIYMLRLTHGLMTEEDASFIVTGEVLGQRPMSQQRRTMDLIERQSGLEGLIVRPLSAKFFPPTLPEKEGVLDREGLFGISGRSRRVQYELAEEYGLTRFSCPAGGCLLTDPIFAHKLRDLFTHQPAFSMGDIALLRVGRHFTFEGKRLVLGRNKEENDYLSHFWSPPYCLIHPRNFKGPSGLIKGELDEGSLPIVANIMAFYGKSDASPIIIEAHCHGEVRRHAVERAEINPEQYRIKEEQ
jgi:tRNA U34 2-thiouridine synthase MnmA/TrmU